MKSLGNMSFHSGWTLSLLASIVGIDIPKKSSIDDNILDFGDSRRMGVSPTDMTVMSSASIDIGVKAKMYFDIMNKTKVMHDIVGNVKRITDHPLCGHYFPDTIIPKSGRNSSYVYIGHVTPGTTHLLTVSNEFFRSLYSIEDLEEIEDHILNEFTTDKYIALSSPGISDNTYVVEYLLTHILPKTSRDDDCIEIIGDGYHLCVNDDIHALYVLSNN